MTDNAASPTWLRIASAGLTAWCGFSATINAITVLALTFVVVGNVSPGEPKEAEAGYYVFCFGAAIAAVVAALITAWQWRRMRRATSGDHVWLILVLLVVAIAVSVQPFVYATF